MKNQLLRILLLQLHAADGVPMPESSLVAGAQLNARPCQPTVSDVTEALRLLEGLMLINGVTDVIDGRSWTITEKGLHRARQY